MVLNKTIKYLILTSLLSLFADLAWSQQNNLHLEVGGVSGHLSINYERMLFERCNWRIYVAVGFSPGLFDDNEFSPRIPVQLKGSFQINNFEIISGTSVSPYLWQDDSGEQKYDIKDFSIAIFGNVGLRYNFLKNKMFIGLAYTPLIIDQSDFDYIHWGALDIGYKF